MSIPHGTTRTRVLDAVGDLTTARGYPPTVREIARHVGLRSPATVHAHLLRLVRDGLLTRDAGSPRTFRPVPKPGAR